MDQAIAKTLWCPDALVKTEVHKREFTAEWKDFWLIGVLRFVYNIAGNFIAVTVINRTKSGDPHPDCLCIGELCQWWDKLSSDCSVYGDNMNAVSLNSDPDMEKKWCAKARPENDPDEDVWSGNTDQFKGKTIAIASANRVAGGSIHPGSKCITSKCKAYTTNGGTGAGCGSCMAADKNMQR